MKPLETNKLAFRSNWRLWTLAVVGLQLSLASFDSFAQSLPKLMNLQNSLKILVCILLPFLLNSSVWKKFLPRLEKRKKLNFKNN